MGKSVIILVVHRTCLHHQMLPYPKMSSAAAVISFSHVSDQPGAALL